MDHTGVTFAPDKIVFVAGKICLKANNLRTYQPNMPIKCQKPLRIIWVSYLERLERPSNLTLPFRRWKRDQTSRRWPPIPVLVSGRGRTRTHVAQGTAVPGEEGKDN